jgi:hypothetical protein
MKIWSDDAAFVYSHRAPPIDPGLLLPCPHCAETSWYWLLVHTALKEPEERAQTGCVCRGVYTRVEQDFNEWTATSMV